MWGNRLLGGSGLVGDDLAHRLADDVGGRCLIGDRCVHDLGGGNFVCSRLLQRRVSTVLSRDGSVVVLVLHVVLVSPERLDRALLALVQGHLAGALEAQ